MADLAQIYAEIDRICAISTGKGEIPYAYTQWMRDLVVEGPYLDLETGSFIEGIEMWESHSEQIANVRRHRAQLCKRLNRMDFCPRMATLEFGGGRGAGRTK